MLAVRHSNQGAWDMTDTAVLESIASRALASWNEHDVAAILDDYDPDAVYDAHDGSPAKEGVEAIAAEYHAIFERVPGLRFEPLRLRVGGDYFVAEFRGSAIAQDGSQVSFDFADVITVRDGKIVGKDSYIGQMHPSQLRSETATRAASTPEGRRHSDAEVFVSEFTAAWSQPTPESLTALYTEDGIVEHPGMDSSVHGRAAIIEYWTGLLDGFDSITAAVVDHALGRSALLIHIRITALTNGTELCWDAMDRFELEGTKAAAGTAYFDPAAIRPLASVEPGS
jgi:ketosteroid isomerase-like protein